MIKLAPRRAAAVGDRGCARRPPAPHSCHPAPAPAARARPRGPAPLPFPLIGDHDPYIGSSIIYGRLCRAGAPPDPPHQPSPPVAGGAPPSDQRQLPPGPYPSRRATIPSSCLARRSVISAIPAWRAAAQTSLVATAPAPSRLRRKARASSRGERSLPEPSGASRSLARSELAPAQRKPCSSIVYASVGPTPARVDLMCTSARSTSPSAPQPASSTERAAAVKSIDPWPA